MLANLVGQGDPRNRASLVLVGHWLHKWHDVGKLPGHDPFSYSATADHIFGDPVMGDAGYQLNLARSFTTQPAARALRRCRCLFGSVRTSLGGT